MSNPYPRRFRAACIDGCEWYTLEYDSHVALTAARVHGELKPDHLAHVVLLDPQPWRLDCDGDPRYQYPEVQHDGSEWGGTVYNLAKWAPRPGYSQNQEDYA